MLIFRVVTTLILRLRSQSDELLLQLPYVAINGRALENIRQQIERLTVTGKYQQTPGNKYTLAVIFNSFS